MKRALILSCVIGITRVFGELGEASWYCLKCNGGDATASGEVLDDGAMTAAHKSLKLGSVVRVTRTDTGESVVVRINDRGPYIKGRIIDLTSGAAKRLGMYKRGVAPVKLEVLAVGDGKRDFRNRKRGKIVCRGVGGYKIPE